MKITTFKVTVKADALANEGIFILSDDYEGTNETTIDVLGKNNLSQIQRKLVAAGYTDNEQILEDSVFIRSVMGKGAQATSQNNAIA